MAGPVPPRSWRDAAGARVPGCPGAQHLHAYGTGMPDCAHMLTEDVPGFHPCND